MCVIVVFPDYVHLLLHVKCKAEKTAVFAYKNSKGLGEPVHLHIFRNFRERSGSVIECMFRDRGVVGSSLTDFTTLCPWAR